MLDLVVDPEEPFVPRMVLQSVRDHCEGVHVALVADVGLSQIAGNESVLGRQLKCLF
jgi:hypothetical protein